MTDTPKFILMACPFCGGEANFREDYDHTTAAYIGCGTTGCFGWYNWGETEAEAIAAWNRRAPVPTFDAITVVDEFETCDTIARQNPALAKRLVALFDALRATQEK